MKTTRNSAAVGLVMTLALAGCGGSDDNAATTPTGQIATIQVLSTRPDIVSAGDALVEIKSPAGADVTKLKVDVDGVDVTSQFAVRPDGRYYGLVTGLKVGKNVLRAAEAGTKGAVLEITNYPKGGPVISGAQVGSWVCTTKVAAPTATNPDLGNPLDAQCNIAAPVYRYQYRTLAGAFATYDPANPPAAALIASTTTDQGNTVPYIVRIERGVINRGKYDLAYLANPTTPTQSWKPWDSTPNWNHKLFWKFGSGCEYGRTQGNPGNVVDHDALSRGFLVASSEMTQYGSHCNDVTSAETVIMIKEHIAEQYGRIRFTMSDGGSGGAHQQNLHSSNYPGLIQGMLPTQTFQDTWTPGREFADCGLLKRFYDLQAGTAGSYTNPEKAAINGHRWEQVCEGPASINMASRTPYYMDPTVGDAGCGGQPTTWSLTNLTGIRCTLQDFNIAIFGARDATGYAKTPQDNVGIQYGYNAVNQGKISAEKFVTLNEQVGGYDINARWQPNRMQADAGAVELTHKSGRVTHGKYLGDVAIIDRRDFNITEEHYDFRTWVIRNRLLKENGDYSNQVIWRYKSTPPALAARAFETLNQWLMNVETDTSNTTLHQKIVANRPAAAVDSCWRADLAVWSTDVAYCNLSANPSTAATITGTGATAVPSPTIDEWPVYRDTRVASGEPLASDVMKCQLKPLVRADFFVSFTDTQWSRLQAVFPNGVCDYGKPGVGQVAPQPWQTFVDGPGGRPLGTAPVSHPE